MLRASCWPGRKEVTHAKDAVDAARRELPMTEVTKDHTCTGPGGQVSLAGLFGGRRQLITYHFMWRHEQSGFPGQDQGCPTCSFLADSIGHLSHLHGCDTTLVLVSARRSPASSGTGGGWAGPRPGTPATAATSTTTSTLASTRRRPRWNTTTRTKDTLAREAPCIRPGTNGPGVSVFLSEGDRVFHTYSAYERGLDSLLGTSRWLELAPLGRQRHVTGFPYHDTYDQEP